MKILRCYKIKLKMSKIDINLKRSSAEKFNKSFTFPSVFSKQGKDVTQKGCVDVPT
jgi:hypothetical protein